jgi:hypothetical protein
MQQIDYHASRLGWGPRHTAYVKQRWEKEMRFFSYFLVDPAGALAQIGAQVGPERRIHTLYRVRVVFPEEELAWLFGQWETGTFGYPIFIAEDTDPV